MKNLALNILRPGEVRIPGRHATNTYEFNYKNVNYKLIVNYGYSTNIGIYTSIRLKETSDTNFPKFVHDKPNILNFVSLYIEHQGYSDLTLSEYLTIMEA